MAIPDLVPDSVQLANVFSQAAAPTFLLGAVAGFISLLLGRLKGLLERMASVSAVPAAAGSPAADQKQVDIGLLKRRAMLLNRATYLALGGGICTTLLLLLMFAAAFFKLQHIYGGGILFVLANLLLTLSLYMFAKEVRSELGDIHKY